jgi:hypothetical protein
MPLFSGQQQHCNIGFLYFCGHFCGLDHSRKDQHWKQKSRLFALTVFFKFPQVFRHHTENLINVHTPHTPPTRQLIVKLLVERKSRVISTLAEVAKVGVLRASHKIFNSEVRICWNDASKFSSISSSQLTFCCV